MALGPIANFFNDKGLAGQCYALAFDGLRWKAPRTSVNCDPKLASGYIRQSAAVTVRLWVHAYYTAMHLALTASRALSILPRG